MAQQISGSDLQLQDIYQHIVNEKEVPHYDAEHAAHYFIEIRTDFESIKRSISAISGGIILFHAGGKNLLEGSGAIVMTLQALYVTKEHLQSLRVPRGLEHHHGTLVKLTDELIELCDKPSVKHHLFAISNENMHRLMQRIQVIYETLKKTVCMPLGLSMVALESGCACGLHKNPKV